MLSEIFLPERFGNQRILSKIIISFYIENETITSVLVHAKRSKTIVENLIEQKIEIDNNIPSEEQISNAIKKILSKTKKFDQVRIAVPASLVIFKEINVPFVDEDKIRMILDYEIESMLPFSLDESVIDFIITKQINTKQKKESQILVAIIRNQDLKKIIDTYNSAGIEPTNITIDLFSIYSIYQQIEGYNKSQKSEAIIHLEGNATKISFLQKGQLRLARHLPKGLNNIIQNISTKTQMDIISVKNKLLNQGISKIFESEFNKIAQEEILKFFHEIQFTLSSFSSKLNLENGIEKVFFTGHGNEIKGMVKFVKNLLQIPCENLEAEKIFSNKLFKNKLKSTKNLNAFIVALGTAMPSQQQVNFELRRKEFVLPNIKLLTKQVSAVTLLVVTMFLAIITNGHIQIKTLKNRAQSIELKKIKKLKEIFPEKSSSLKKKTLMGILKDAEKLVNQKSEMWNPFTREQLRILPILQELTRLMDKRKFDVTINEISIEDVKNETSFININGFFKSKTGSDNFQYFSKLENRFKESQFLQLREEIDPKLTDDKGIEFTAKLKLKN